MTNLTFDIFEAIVAERGRQERLRQTGKFPYTIAAGGIPNDRRLAILLEEVGEVARLCNTEAGASGRWSTTILVGELVQVAACAVGWLEALGGFRRE